MTAEQRAFSLAEWKSAILHEMKGGGCRKAFALLTAEWKSAILHEMKGGGLGLGVSHGMNFLVLPSLGRRPRRGVGGKDERGILKVGSVIL